MKNHQSTRNIPETILNLTGKNQISNSNSESLNLIWNYLIASVWRLLIKEWLTYFSCTHELIRTEMSVMIMIAATLLLLLERLHTGLLCGSEVVSPVGNVETGEGPGKHHSRYHIYSLGARVEMKPELCSQDRPDLVGRSSPHEGGNQGREQDGFGWSSRRRRISPSPSLGRLLLIAVRSEILIYKIFYL